MMALLSSPTRFIMSRYQQRLPMAGDKSAKYTGVYYRFHIRISFDKIELQLLGTWLSSSTN